MPQGGSAFERAVDGRTKMLCGYTGKRFKKGRGTRLPPWRRTPPSPRNDSNAARTARICTLLSLPAEARAGDVTAIGILASFSFAVPSHMALRHVYRTTRDVPSSAVSTCETLPVPEVMASRTARFNSSTFTSGTPARPPNGALACFSTSALILSLIIAKSPLVSPSQAAATRSN